jgi:hypothetical protein
MEGIMSKEEILDVLKQLATPIDFEELAAKGILKKSGAWYIVLKPKDLPQHAWKQATAMEQGREGEVKLKFKDSSKSAKALYKKITGKPLP